MARITRMAKAAAKAMTVLALAAVSSTAVAEDKVIHEADRIVTRKKTVVSFDEVNVEGELSKPEGSYVLNRPKAGFPSRIKVRGNFQPELQKSVDAL